MQLGLEQQADQFCMVQEQVLLNRSLQHGRQAPILVFWHASATPVRMFKQDLFPIKLSAARLFVMLAATVSSSHAERDPAASRLLRTS